MSAAVEKEKKTKSGTIDAPAGLASFALNQAGGTHATMTG
jgi:hypothetical protein